MRLWTVHPKYLDAQGLVALWREGLLARAVLRGRTRVYRRHPQLARFRAHRTPRCALNAYLEAVAAEATRRGYAFDRSRIGPVRLRARPLLRATRGQLAHEWRHLLSKLARRSPALHRRWRAERRVQPHPLFRLVRGGVEPWERGARLKTPRRLPRPAGASGRTRRPGRRPTVGSA